VLIAAAGSRGPQTFVASDRMARFDADSSRPECANSRHPAQPGERAKSDPERTFKVGPMKGR
jgi:hypothetical protein